jgi:hypothetical protein
MSEGVFYRCYYQAEYPVDEYGRPGGLYSLADLPIAKYEVLHRKGVVEAKDDDADKYKVRDVDGGWIVWVSKKDVHIGDIHNGDPWNDWRKRKSEVE